MSTKSVMASETEVKEILIKRQSTADSPAKKVINIDNALQTEMLVPCCYEINTEHSFEQNTITFACTHTHA